MTASVQFSGIQELETALRALVLFKFSGANDADIYVGSPVMAGAMNSMLAAIENYWMSSGNSKRAEAWRDLYVLSNAEHRTEAIKAYAARHPKWNSMNRDEKVSWLKVIAAPYALDGGDLGSLEAFTGE
jgi:hypothetical protein